MPDICDLIMDDHEVFRRRFAELDELRAGGAATDRLMGVWQPLARMLEEHASAEEEHFYPHLLHHGANAEEETDDAVSDHNDIRKAIAKAEKAKPGSDDWWGAVLKARDENSNHMGEEERESLPDLREHLGPARREELGAQWLRYSEKHSGAAGLSLDAKDVDKYIEAHS